MLPRRPCFLWTPYDKIAKKARGGSRMKIWNISGIRKTMIRMIGCLMILCLLGSSVMAEGISKEAFYQEGIAGLEDMTLESAQNAASSFTAAGNYQLAPLYKQYALSLAEILSAGAEEINLRTTIAHLQVIAKNEEFGKSLADHSLPTCETLIEYIQARQYEESGDYIAALNIYKTYFNLLDCLDRQLSLSDMAYQQAEELYRDGDYQAAAEIFQNLDYADSTERYQQVLSDHEHQWTEATCTKPRTCAVFGETEGEPLGHDWLEATCTKPKTCKRCGATEGEPLGHDWQAASCTEPGVCTRCGITGSDAAGHDWKDATCTEPKTCARCGATEGEALGHDWLEATYTDPQTCARCGETVGSPLIHPGSVIPFGRYEQDNNAANGPEAIEWIVLEYDEADHKALLLSRYGLDAKSYNSKSASTTWENCTLRTWLNSDFLNTAFSVEEKASILITEVNNSTSHSYSKWNTKSGNNTQDKIFLLSYSEANRYLNVIWGNKDNTGSRAAPTLYAVQVGANISSEYSTADGSTGWWWLRSPGSFQNHAAIVNVDGSLFTCNIDHDEGLVRPALLLNLGPGVF